MSETPQPTPQNPEKPAAGPAPVVLIGVVAAALIAGGAVGAFLVGPRFVPKAAAKTTAAAEGEGAAEHSKKGKHGEEKKSVHKIENLIVNPAGSQGARFLMTTVAIEVSDEKTIDLLRDRDVQVRDRVIAMFESKSLEDLTRPGSREKLKRELEELIEPIAGNPASLHVYLPQFVIQ